MPNETILKIQQPESAFAAFKLFAQRRRQNLTRRVYSFRDKTFFSKFYEEINGRGNHKSRDKLRVGNRAKNKAAFFVSAIDFDETSADRVENEIEKKQLPVEFLFLLRQKNDGKDQCNPCDFIKLRGMKRYA